MQSLLEFSAIKSCPELSADYILLSDSPPSSQGFANHLQLTYPAYQRLSESEFDSSSNGPQEVTMTTLPDDTIEILSCRVDRDEDYDDESMGGSAAAPDKMAGGETQRDDPASVHRKRVVRAVGAVTFLLLLFSLILIGISLNMSKEIDELVRQSTLAMRNPQSNLLTRKENLTQHA